MGKIYKNPNPPVSPKTIQLSKQTLSIPIKKNPAMDSLEQTNNTFILPNAIVIPLDQFDDLLQKALLFLEQKNYSKALPILLNLEVTDFNNVQVHELLADLFLNINQLTLAKEQLQICSQLIKSQTNNDIFTLKSFDQLVEEAGDFDQLETDFKEILATSVNDDNFHSGTKIALNLATHHMAANRYKEAEQILTTYRDLYLNDLENIDS